MIIPITALVNPPLLPEIVKNRCFFHLVANPHHQPVTSREPIFIVVFRELYPIVQLIMINCFICKGS